MSAFVSPHPFRQTKAEEDGAPTVVNGVLGRACLIGPRKQKKLEWATRPGR